MFDTIILLTGPVEQTALTQVLRQHNPRLTVCPVATRAELDAIAPGVLARARLIGFVTAVIVPAHVLGQLGFGAYNFHPGPPHYPGWVPAQSAIFDRAMEFGATAHVMAERVDSGPIVGVEKFRIPPDATVQRLEEMAFAALARLFLQLAAPLATQSEPLPVLPVRWSGQKSTRRCYTAMCDIEPGISKDELDRRIAAFGGGQFGLAPVITLHGHRFQYLAPETPITSPGLVPAMEPVNA